MGLSIFKYALIGLVSSAWLVGCDVFGSKAEPETGFYVHIKADFEVIETGEALNFDYVMSCYNREVPGSFAGVLKPKTIFKPTSTGAAIAIFPPEHYCSRGLRGRDLETPWDTMTIPQVAWYPDVNDLSYAISYMLSLIHI